MQIDLRYADAKQGDVIVVVAPVLRFKDVGFNANVSLEDLGPPDRLISGAVADRLVPHAASRRTVLVSGG